MASPLLVFPEDISPVECESVSWNCFRAVRLAQEKVNGKPPASLTSKKHPLYRVKYPATAPDPKDDVPQSTAKRYMPPNTYIWRANTIGAWLWNFPGVARGRVPWSRFDNNSFAAMNQCLRDAWRAWLEHHSLPLSHCPIANLF